MITHSVTSTVLQETIREWFSILLFFFFPAICYPIAVISEVSGWVPLLFMNSKCHKAKHNQWLQEKLWSSCIHFCISYSYSLCMHKGSCVSRLHGIYYVHKYHLWIHRGSEKVLGHYYLFWNTFSYVSILTF